MPEFAVDLHNHSRFFHGFTGRPTPYDPVGLRLHALAARARGLDGLAVTNHDYAYTGNVGLPAVPGIEVSTTRGHVVVVGPDPPRRTTPGELTPVELVDRAHERGCAAILAHPFRKGTARDSDADFDAVELNGKNPEHDVRTMQLADRRGLPVVGGSDAHYPIEVGRAYTTVEADSLAPADVADAIRAGRVSPVSNLGRFHQVIDYGYNAVHRGRRWLRSRRTDAME
ncbi:PHP domain-containing protein [Halorarum halophilum]|uniref:PHP domain-containing protein n=1 Tax=Halorarum halophilum TaxID=2743090 RepID=A0A7D5KDV2_9EURY|nr:PHP domain-containing protein [Halobaculum halophilum]QLG27737.1 PHP domain-containing protein [Halobaculum halophilum]